MSHLTVKVLQLISPISGAAARPIRIRNVDYEVTLATQKISVPVLCNITQQRPTKPDLVNA